MPIWTIYDANGVAKYSYQAETKSVWKQYPEPEYSYVESPDPPPPPPPPPAIVEPIRITKLAFRNRFSISEKITIEIAALDKPTGSPAERQGAAMLRVFLDDVRVANHIDLTRPDTRAGVEQLESLGLLAAGRAAAILDAPPTDEELWHG